MSDVLALRHVAFEDLGLLEPLLTGRGHRIRYAEPARIELTKREILAPDLLVVLGGPIGVYETVDYPFLTQEIALVAQRLAADQPVLGLCLGCQIMAAALGARVYPAAAKELGWGAVTLTKAGRAGCLQHLAPAPAHPGSSLVLHWHGDTFDLPAGAVHLASSTICPNQAFAWGDRALALQFHAEVDPPALESWFVGHAVEIANTPGVSVAGLRTDTAQHTPAVAAAGRAVFTAWLDQVGL